jgi:hypothetical protein
MTKQIADALHSGEYAYITSDGQIVQTDNSHFSGKAIGSIDTAAEFTAEEVLQPFTDAFAELVTERDNLVVELETASDPDSLKKAFLEKATATAAVGDFDNLMSFLNDTSATEIAEEAPEAAAEEVAEVETEEDQPTIDSPSEDVEEDDEEEVELVAEVAEVEAAPVVDEIHHDDQPVAEEEHEEQGDQEEPEVVAEASEEPAGFVPAEAAFSEGDPHYPFEQFVLKAEAIAVSNDWQYGNLEFENIRFKWDELTALNDDAQKDLVARLQKAQTHFNERRSAHFEKMTQVRAVNLDRKKELLERLETIVRDGRWNAVNELKSLERRWEKIRQIPHDEVEKMQKRFDALRTTFEEKRVDFLVKRKEREEENLNIKMLILDKMDMINVSINEETLSWDNLDNLFEGLSQQWRKVGPVTVEKEDEIWNRYRTALDAYQQNKLTFNKAYRAELEKNLKKKTTLCEQAEALVAEEDLVNAARTINRLHREWKECGPVSKDQSEVLWERFKKASDAFNERKNSNLDVIRDAENANYEAKEKLCEQAEALSTINDYGKATREMQMLSNQWKDIGPVPRRKTKPLWNRFKKAMDDFFEKRRDSLKNARHAEKENYKAKKDIIDKINKLIELEDPQQAVNEIKPLQEEYQKVGFVPMKYKNKLWTKYKEACDAVYQRAREERASRSIQNANQGPRRQQQQDTGSGDRRKGNDLQRLKKECDELQQMILHYSDTKTFIKPSKQGNKLRDDIQAKIDAAQVKLYSKTEELDALKREAQSAS